MSCGFTGLRQDGCGTACPGLFLACLFWQPVKTPTARTSSPRLIPKCNTAEVLKTEIEATLSVKYGRLLHKKKQLWGGGGAFNLCLFSLLFSAYSLFFPPFFFSPSTHTRTAQLSIPYAPALIKSSRAFAFSARFTIQQMFLGAAHL